MSAEDGKPDYELRAYIGGWIDVERMSYADVKYAEDGDNRAMLVKAMQDGDWQRWSDFAMQYVKKAEIFGFDSEKGRQQLGKAIVTLLHTLETAVMVHGPMPKPGLTSGEIEPWGATLN